MKQKYQPINCNFYDELEILAMRGQSCAIRFWKDLEFQEQLEITDTILTIKIINKAEFLILKEGNPIRLDQLISVDDKELEGYCAI